MSVDEEDIEEFYNRTNFQIAVIPQINVQKKLLSAVGNPINMINAFT